ncbi:16S rRNA (cytidine(1402)-2'-O)-methyltransferase [Microbacterium aurantiacum]|uniref:16S rRNA (cytidine(1402)-2'-O)-methyltransferase n=1 Tax=Microbacterium aurantiacum TaxID=162393 RepID=UPI003F49AF60
MIILAATPIGNLGDASARLVEALGTVPVVAAEDTRTTQRLLAALGVTHRPRLVALHDHNEKERASEIIELARDADVLLLSDAGMPTVSDPGYGVVAAAIAAGVGVTALPGPSAVLTALALSGLPTDRFAFEGFLPRKSGERRTVLRQLAAEARTMVFFDSPSRVAASLTDIAEVFGPDRRVALARELTKMYEEVLRGTAAEVAEQARDGIRGEVVLVVEGAPAREISFADAVAQVRAQVASGIRLKDAAVDVAAHTGHTRRDLYQAALASPDRHGDGAPAGPN